MAYQAWVHGFRLGEVPIHFKNRAREASKLSAEEIYMALLNFALLRFRYGWRPRGARPGGRATPERGGGLVVWGGGSPGAGAGARGAGGAAVVVWPGADPSPLERAGVAFRAAEDVLGSEGLAAADAAARTWARVWGRLPLVEGKGFRELVEWRGSSLLWCAEAFLRTETAGPRCARTAELALRLLEATAAFEVDACGLPEADLLLLARAATARGVLFHGPVPTAGHPLPVARPGARRRGLLRALARALAPAQAPPPPGPGRAARGATAAPILALADAEDTRDALGPLFRAISEGLWRPVTCVTLDELPRWETRRARRAIGEARGAPSRPARVPARHGRARRVLLPPWGGLRGPGGAGTSRRSSSGTSRRRSAGSRPRSSSSPRLDPPPCSWPWPGATSGGLSSSPPRPRGPRSWRSTGAGRTGSARTRARGPLSALDFWPGTDPAPVVARLREAAHGTVEPG